MNPPSEDSLSFSSWNSSDSFIDAALAVPSASIPSIDSSWLLLSTPLVGSKPTRFAIFFSFSPVAKAASPRPLTFFWFSAITWFAIINAAANAAIASPIARTGPKNAQTPAAAAQIDVANKPVPRVAALVTVACTASKNSFFLDAIRSKVFVANCFNSSARIAPTICIRANSPVVNIVIA